MEGEHISTEREARLRPLARSGMLLLGAILLLTAWPVGYLAAVISGGGHGSPFDGSTTEAIWGAAMLAIPLLMIAVGIACLAATNRRRLKFAGAVALLIPLDIAVAIGSLQLLMRTEPPPVAYPVGRPPADLGTMNAIAATGPTHVAIACSVKGDECVETTTTYTPDGPVTTREVEKITPAERP